ncbi:MAG TPA: LysM peptidoglycan-binding domain-containing protein [Ktedonobacterales bacterium]
MRNRFLITALSLAAALGAFASLPAITASAAPNANCRANYTVVWGDTLAKIGARYGVPYMQIANANNIANPNLIYAGQHLCIPGGSDGSSSSSGSQGSASAGSSQAPSSSQGYYPNY